MDVEVDLPTGVSPLERRAEIHRALGDPHRLAIVDALRLSDRAPTDLAAVTGLGSNLVAFHLKVLEQVGIIERIVSEGDARRRYVRLRAVAPGGLDLATTEGAIVAENVLFICTHNSARSQLAAALWQRTTGRPARSAGNEPAAQVHHLALEVAAEHGLDLSSAVPQGLSAAAQTDIDLVVSVCDRVAEAGLDLQAPTLHWSVPDPVTGGREHFEAAYRILADRVAHLAASAA